MIRETLKTPFPRSYWVIPGMLLAGEYPGAKDAEEAKNKLHSLCECGIRKFINLMEPTETDHSGKPFIDYAPTVYESFGKWGQTSFHRFPIPDLGVPSIDMMDEILNAITAGIEKGEPVYVHCWGGVGRTGTVVGCFLIRNGLATPGNVLNVIADLRKDDPKNYRTSPETDKQREFIANWRDCDRAPLTNLSRTIGCLLGGAVGDALGAPVEFMNREEILRRFGPEGISSFQPAYGGLGLITDDTQMTLFTAEGLLRGWVRGCHKGITSYEACVLFAYQRWFRTQDEEWEKYGRNPYGWLIGQRELHHRRAPGNTCLSALSAMKSPDEPVENNSKGCGGVMRIAPAGLFFQRLGRNHTLEEIFKMGVNFSAYTHGHPTGNLPSGVLAILILKLADGASLRDALIMAKELLRREKFHEETLHAIEQAEQMASSGMLPVDAIARIGQGWVAEEALAISIYCALVARNFREGVLLAVNHDGDSDSTGAITGNLLGTFYGTQAIPEEWLDGLELRDVIVEMGTDLSTFRKWDIGAYSSKHDFNSYVWNRYGSSSYQMGNCD